MNDPSAIHIQWLTERFYFAVVEGVRAKGNRWREQALYAAEPQFPVPLEDLHSSIAPGLDGSIIICAVACESLADVPTSVLTLAPRELPPCLAGRADSSQFNLLTGAFEPRRMQRLRRISSVVFGVTAILVGAALVTGLARRTSLLHVAANQHTAAVESVAHRAIGPADGRSTQQLFLQLTAELRALRQTRSTAIVDPELFDAPGTLAEALALWPRDMTIHTESLNVTRSQITIRAGLSSSVDVQLLADALARLEGWQLQQPRVSAASGGGGGGNSGGEGGVLCTIILLPEEIVP